MPTLNEHGQPACRFCGLTEGVAGHSESDCIGESPVAERKFHKTTITYEVLSEEPIPGHVDLEYIAREAMEGRYVGRFVSNDETVLTGKQMADTLYEFGSDPGFFMLDSDGKDDENA